VKQEFDTAGGFMDLFNGLLDPDHMFYSDEVLFILSWYVKRLNSRYWSTENPHAVHEVPVCYSKVRVLVRS
jgi:hypothetical protein